MKKCDHCKQGKDETEFNWRSKKTLGKRHNTCRECIHKFNKTYFIQSLSHKITDVCSLRKYP